MIFYNERLLLQWTAIIKMKVIITMNGDYYNKRRFFLQ